MTTHRNPRGPRVAVNVSAENISEGVRASSSHCMIAEAIKAAFPGARSVAVDISTCRFTDPKKGHRYVYLTPRVAQAALVDFDEGILPAPFSFHLRGPHVTTANKYQKKTDEPSGTKEQDDLAKVKLVPDAKTRTKIPARLGGRRPPQLHLRREFGVRAFRGANIARQNAQQQKAEEGNHAE
jgi:hypothetical protein